MGVTFNNKNEDPNKDNIAEQLSRINEQLAIRNRRVQRIWRVILGVVITVLIFNILFTIMAMVVFNNLESEVEMTTELETVILD